MHNPVALVSEAGSLHASLERGTSPSIVDETNDLPATTIINNTRAKDLAAKKNKQKLESKVIKSRR